MSTQVTSHFTTLPDGQVIHSLQAGTDTWGTVVLLHGGNIDHAALSWGPTLSALAERRYRVIALDAPGYGRSPAPRQPFTLQRATATFSQFADALGLKTFTLGGVSMGGGMALGYTLMQPERVTRLVLVGSYGLQDRAPFHHLSRLLIALPGMNALTRGMLKGRPGLVRRSLSSILRNPAALTDELVQQVMAALEQSQSLEVWSQFQRDEIGWNGVKTCYMPRLSEITCPTLLVQGTHDIGVPLRYAEEAARRLPHARLEIFENAGHWTQRDDAPRFHRLLLDFLNTSQGKGV